MKGSTEKRLVQYAWIFRRGIIVAIIFLMIATALELLGPLIAKEIIDNHILGIEAVWHEVPDKDDKYTVEYEDGYYMREDRISETTEILGNLTVIAIGKSYYVIDGVAPLDPVREENAGQITIGSENPVTVSGTKLSLADSFQFFKPERRPIILLLVLYMGLLVIAGVFQYFQTILLQKSSNGIVRKMRNDIFSHTQKIPASYFVDEPAGSIVSRITNDTEAIRGLYERVLSVLITQSIYMLGIMIVIYTLSPTMALITLFIIPIVYIWMRLYKFIGSKFNLIIRRKNSEINGKISESIQGMSVIQAFQEEDKMKNEFEELNEEIFVNNKKIIRLNSFTGNNLVNVLRNATLVFFIWHFSSLSFEPSSIISIGLLYALIDYIGRFFEPVNQIVSQFPLIEQARAAGTRMFELMDVKGEEVEDTPIPRYEGNIRFDNVSFAYVEEEYVLKNMSFDIKAGETVAFVGHTGSGKSSVMNLLFRFYDPQKGKVLIDNHPIDEWSRQQARSHMGIVLQDPFLFSGTIITNVTMNDPKISREAAIKALQAVGASRFINKLPNGYDEPVSEGGSTYSLGERQLISFARALAFDPAILVLDEATANIDTETEGIIQAALEVLQKGRTTLVIAHRLSTIQKADNIFVLESGTIMETGNHEALIKEKGIYYQMYQMQQGSMNQVS